MARFPGVYTSPYGNSIAALLARQGEIAAQGALQSGAIWSQAINQLGQIGAGAVEQYQQRKDQKTRQDAFDAAVAGWDGQDPMSLYRAIAPHVGPDDAARFAAGMSQLIKVNQGEKPTPEGLKTVVKGIKAARKVYGDEGMAERWPNAAKALEPLAPLLPGPIPQAWDSKLGDYIDAFDAEIHSGKSEGAIVETVGVDGKPIRRRATEAELAQGVPVYKQPLAVHRVRRAERAFRQDPRRHDQPQAG